MTEWEPEDREGRAEQVEETEPTTETVRTGVPEVDGVLDALDGLEDRPVHEHVSVFEDAHEQLRSALDARG